MENVIKDLDLLNSHKTLFENFLKTELGWGLKKRNKAIKIYDLLINGENIRYYYSRHISIFTKALLTNDLDSIANYFPKNYVSLTI